MAAKVRILRKRYEIFLVANPYCARCSRGATEVHHARGRIGADLLREEDWRALCHDCHEWVTRHPREAIESGLSLLRIGRP